MKRRQIFLTLSLLSTGLNAQQHAVGGSDYHIVKAGETLSQIAQATFPERVYSKAGSLEKLLVFNPDIKNPHLIYIGQKISFAELKAMGRERTSADGDYIRQPAAEAPILTNQAKPESVAAPMVAPIVTTPTPAPASPPEEDVDHSLVVLGGYSFTNFHAVDSSTGAVAELSTNQDIQLAATLAQSWTPTFKSFFTFAGRSVNFNPSNNVNKTISNTKKNLFNLSVGGKHMLSPAVKVKYWVSYTNQLFVYGLTSNAIAIDSVAIPSANIEASFKILSKGKTSLGVTGAASYYFSSKADSYTVSNGTGYGASIYLRRDYDEKTFGISVGIQERNQESSVASNKERNIFGAINYSIPLFKDDKK
jgi:hypothetical protein